MSGLVSALLLLASLVSAVALVVGAASPAGAELIDRGHDHIVDNFSDELCGVPVDVHVDIIDNFSERIGRNGLPMFLDTGRGSFTNTNPANGKTVVVSFAGPSKDVRVTDNGDGTLTVLTQVSGVPEKIRVPGSPPLSIDAGRIVFSNLIDDNGTPAFPDDDKLISRDVVFEAGPHPDLDSDFGLFCEVVLPALT